MPPGSASASKRAATFTPSPKMSPASVITSPWWMPTRNSMRLSWGDVRIPLGHPTLHLHGTAERVHDTRELDEEAVSGGLHDPTTVLGDFWIHESAAVLLQPSERTFLVGRHETTVANDISGQDGCKPTLYALSG